MPLPNPTMDAVPFTPITSEWGDDIIENIESLSNGTGFEDGAIDADTLADSAVTASKLSASAITLGYAQITSNITTASTSIVQATGLTTSVTIPSGGRRTKITVFAVNISNSSASNGSFISLWDGTVGSGTQLQQANFIPATNIVMSLCWSGTPSAGSKTYNVGFATITSGTTTIGAGSTSPAFILVEAI